MTGARSAAGGGTGPSPGPGNGARRAQLSAAAAELFATRGYASVAVEEVAAAAGVTGPSVYRHFAGKRALLTEVVLGGMTDLEQLSGQALDPTTAGTGLAGPDTPLESLLAELVAMAVRRPAAAVVWRWTGSHLEDAARREVGRRAHHLLAGWVQILRHERPGLGEDEAELLWWGVLSALGSVVNHRGRLGPRRTRTLLCAAAVRLLGVTPAPPTPAPPTPAPPSSARPPVATVLLGGRREEIVHAASALFAERGFAAVGIDEIGAVIGIAGPSVYRHFPSKVSILVAVCQRAADRLVLGAAVARRAGIEPHRVMCALVGSYVETLLDSTDLRVGMSTDRSSIIGPEQEALLRRQRDYVALWVAALVAARPELVAREATVLVHAGLTVANDLARTGAVASRAGLGGELVTLVLAVLDVPAVDGP